MKVSFNTYRPYSQQNNNRNSNSNSNINSNTIANTKHVAFGYDGCDFDVYDPDAPDTYSILDFFNLFKRKHKPTPEEIELQHLIDEAEEKSKKYIAENGKYVRPPGTINEFDDDYE